MKGSQISYLWKNPDAARNFGTGVSLHSHTNRSKETLDFVVKVISSDGFLGSSLPMAGRNTFQTRSCESWTTTMPIGRLR